MSRRRESYVPTEPVTTDDLMRAMYGSQQRQAHAPVPGCSAACCAPLVLDGGPVEAAIVRGIWRGIWWALGIELAAVALLLLAGAAWRAAAGWMGA